MKSYPLIEALTNAKGISGFEKEVVEVAEKFVMEGLETSWGGLNNFYIFQKGGEEKPVLLLDAHSDELGFMVQSITSKGLIKIIPIGSWDVRNVPAHSVQVFTEKNGWIKGVFSSKPPHFITEEEMKQNTSFEKLLVDVGASSYQEAVDQFGIQLGAPIVPDVKTEIMLGNRIIGKAFDNRMGCALVIDLMNHFKDRELGVRLVGALSSQEEVGSRGARVTSFDILPEAAIIFEGTPADDTFTEDCEIQGGIGRGSQIRHRDNSMISSPEFTRFAIQLAQTHQIPFQEAVRRSGGTNGGIYHMTNQGVPAIVLGVPVRYAHTHFGISAYEDYEATFNWAVKLIESLTEEALLNF